METQGREVRCPGHMLADVAIPALIGIVLAASAVRAADAAGPGERRPCQEEPAIPIDVSEATDAATLSLKDGAVLRLAGVEPPDTDGRAKFAPETARIALAALIKHGALHVVGPAARDRHGRRVGLVTVRQNNAEFILQSKLVSEGHVRAGIRHADRTCAAFLLAAERKARAGKLGLWSDPYYEIRKAEEPAAVLAMHGRFALVEGKVVSVRESGGTIYVNFGRRWSEDFTVTVARRNERPFQAAGVALKDLAHRRIRVRGVVEARGGPWIELIAPEQIEILAEGH